MKKETKELLNSEFTRMQVASLTRPYWDAFDELRRAGNCIINKYCADLFYWICTEELNIPLCGGAIIIDDNSGEAIGRCFYVD